MQIKALMQEFAVALRAGDIPLHSKQFSFHTCRVLAEILARHEINAVDVAQWLAAASALPIQARLDDGFGQPSITLYNDESIRIDVLFWVDASTGIHQHAFAGAFAVLEGSSLHLSYSFETEEVHSDRLKLGKLTVDKTEILRAGDIRAIFPDEGLIHSLMHLERPTVTLIARTCCDASRKELAYHPPRIAFDPHPRNVVGDKQVGLLRFFNKTDLDRAVPFLRRLVEAADEHSAYLILNECGHHGTDHPIYAVALDTIVNRFGNLAQHFHASVVEQSRRMLIYRLGKVETKTTTRFLLAALICGTSRAHVEEICVNSALFKDVEEVHRRLASLWAKLNGIDTGDVFEQIALCCLKGLPAERVLSEIPGQHGIECSDIGDAYRVIIASPLFTSYFVHDCASWRV